MEGFEDMVKNCWNAPWSIKDPLDRWQYKIRLLRRVCKGWNANYEAAQNKSKQKLVAEYDLLDIESETKVLSPPSKNRMDKIALDLQNIWRLEEISPDKDPEKEVFWRGGGRNTAYFHALANHRRRKNKLIC